MVCTSSSTTSKKWCERFRLIMRRSSCTWASQVRLHCIYGVHLGTSYQGGKSHPPSRRCFGVAGHLHGHESASSLEAREGGWDAVLSVVPCQRLRERILGRSSCSGSVGAVKRGRC